ncbi:MAG: hypothetical protein MJ252_26865 [archaeon]|nr:hypothetical protein [archaeon]
MKTYFRENFKKDELRIKISNKETKKEINQQYLENEELRKEKQSLENKLKNFYNLPPDVNQIKILLEIKREEYKNLVMKGTYGHK